MILDSNLDGAGELACRNPGGGAGWGESGGVSKEVHDGSLKRTGLEPADVKEIGDERCEEVETLPGGREQFGAEVKKISSWATWSSEKKWL